MKLLHIKRSKNPKKKWTARFYEPRTNDYIHVDFGQNGASDYTIHKDPLRKERYLERHKKNEDWNNPLSAGALSRYILWEYPSFDKAVREYKHRFNL